MKNTIKYLLLAFLGICLISEVSGTWEGTFYVDVKEGEDDCDYPAFIGSVRCQQSTLEVQSQNWVGYQTYTFYMDAEDGSGWAKGYAILADYSEPQQNCTDTNQVGWIGSTPNPPEITIVLTPEIE